MISAQTIAMMKRVSQSFMTDTCTIDRRSTITDEYGAPADIWVNVATGVACRIITGYAFTSSQTGDVGSQTAIREVLRLEVPTGTGLQTDYRVTVGANVYMVVALQTELTNEVFEQAVIERAR